MAAAVEIDGRDEVGHVAVAARRVFDPLDLRVDRLALGVGRPKLHVRQDVLYPLKYISKDNTTMQ